MSQSEPMPEKSHPRFSYADYEKAIRGPNYAQMEQESQRVAKKFVGCQRVLDVASGQGILLDALHSVGVPAIGVDNQSDLVHVCRERGLTVIEDDALHYLALTDERFDGIHCAHIIEHLPYEAMLNLIEGLRRVLSPGGLVVLMWPNSRSIAVQHLSFWRDPTHERLYDGQLLEAILRFYGFDVLETQYDKIISGTIFDNALSDVKTDKQESESLHTDRVAPRSPSALRVGAGTVFRRFKKGPLHNITPIKQGIRIAERLLSRRHYRQISRLVYELPVEAVIVARRAM